MNKHYRKFIIDESADTFCHAPALISGDHSIDYRTYNRIVSETSRKLRESGFLRGGTLGLQCPNSIQYIITLMALLRSGTTAVIISTRHPATQVHSLLQNVAGKSNSEANSPKAAAQIGIFSETVLREFVDLNVSLNSEHALEASHFLADRDATVLFTSGSSGMPKAVIHTYNNHFYSALGANQNISFQPGDRWLLSLPLYHVGGYAIIIRAALGGGCVVTPEPNLPLDHSLEKYDITHISLVSTQLYRLLQDKKALKVLSELKAVILGGSACYPSIITKALQEKIPIFTSYGSTEMASQVTTTKPGDPPERKYTAGKVLENRRLEISPDGEILVKGRTLFKGYIEDGRIVTSLDDDGWFRTGDLGSIDNDGYLTVTGRKDSMFISGGENIYPEEIEQTLSFHEDVIQAIVVPVPHEEFGARPVAFINMKQKKPVEPHSLKMYLFDKLPKYKIPDHFFSMPDISVDNNLKAVREHFIRLAAEKMP